MYIDDAAAQKRIELGLEGAVVATGKLQILRSLLCVVAVRTENDEKFGKWLIGRDNQQNLYENNVFETANTMGIKSVEVELRIDGIMDIVWRKSGKSLAANGENRLISRRLL